jgi:hypothetical protein
VLSAGKAFFSGTVGVVVAAAGVLMTLLTLAAAFADARGSPWMWLFFGTLALFGLAFWHFYESHASKESRTKLALARRRGFEVRHRGWTPDHAQCAIQSAEEYDAWQQDYDRWVKETGQLIREVVGEPESHQFEVPKTPDRTIVLPHYNAAHLNRLQVFDERVAVLDRLIERV